MSKEFIRHLRLFADVSEEDLDRIYDMTVPVDLKAGELLIEEDTVGDAMYIVLSGEFEVTKRAGKQEVMLDTRVAGEVIGEMSLLAKEPRTATVRAVKDSQVLEVSEFAFEQLLSCSRSAGTIMLQGMASRLRSMEALLAQQEKMAGLGKLTAGIAHELNNPAAAVRRSADQLSEVLSNWQRLTVALETQTFDAAQAGKLNVLRDEMAKRAAKPVILDPLTRSDREGELETWLDDHNVPDAWELSPLLVSFGWGVDNLDALMEDFSEEQLAVVVPWLATGSSSYQLVLEIGKGAEQISQIVKAVKTYSFLDQAPIQRVDIHEGLENTLVILRHKLKSGVTVKREYADDLPEIEAYGSELNQVWTNIIDNAIDAMEGSGEITLHTYKKDDDVVVEIADNGPGIPPDVVPHIFQPFYTTKEPGVGTGLGLHIVYNIIVVKHGGQVTVDSKPGETRFKIVLPMQPPREGKD